MAAATALAAARDGLLGAARGSPILTGLRVEGLPDAAQVMVIIDPAQESIARQSGGAASTPEASYPELRVVRMRGVEGACR